VCVCVCVCHLACLIFYFGFMFPILVICYSCYSVIAFYPLQNSLAKSFNAHHCLKVAYRIDIIENYKYDIGIKRKEESQRDFFSHFVQV